MPRLMVREGAAMGFQAVLFLLCVILAMVSLVAERGLSGSIDSVLRQDARSFLGGDIVIHSHSTMGESLQSQVDDLVGQAKVQAAATYTFYSMVRSADSQESLLAQVKVVADGYPFYGRVELQSNRDLAEQLQPGSALVEQALLDRLELKVGDTLRLGNAELLIRDVIIREPDRPVEFFSFGPRVMVNTADLTAINLIRPGSRVSYDLLLKVTREADLESIADQLSRLAEATRERVSTYRNAPSGIRRFYDNFLFFLSLIAIFTLLLAGIAMERSVTALLQGRIPTIAILRTLGAKGSTILVNYLLLILGLGLCGALLGLIPGLGLQRLLFELAGSILPKDAVFSFSWIEILRALGTELVVVLVFSLLPLLRLRDVKPASIFSGALPTGQRKSVVLLASIVILGFFITLVMQAVESVRTGLIFIGGTIGLLTACYLLVRGFFLVLDRLRFRSLVIRRGVRGLFRPGNSSVAILTTLSASCALLFTIFLVEQNLNAVFVDSFPEEAPNLYFVDIQKSQIDEFNGLIDMPTVSYPVVRGRVEKVNGISVNRDMQQRKRGDNLAREFSLTWRDSLLADETILEGESLFQPGLTSAQVSILDYMAEDNDLRLGDVISFNIQGMPLEATVTSIRGRRDRPARPFFVFVFPSSVLAQAPQTYFTGVRVEAHQVGEIQNRIVSRLPNVSVIDIGSIVLSIAGLLHKLVFIVRFMALLSFLAGVLLIAGSITATRAERIREAVFYKVLGAGSGFVNTMFLLENSLLGIGSGLIGMLLAQGIAWAVCRYQMRIDYLSFAGSSLVMMVGVVVLAVMSGWLASIRILRQKPATYLQQTEGGDG